MPETCENRLGLVNIAITMPVSSRKALRSTELHSAKSM